jgi:hypothetical protein
MLFSLSLRAQHTVVTLELEFADVVGTRAATRASWRPSCLTGKLAVAIDATHRRELQLSIV